MSKNNENKQTPKLRFPEFANEKGWEEKKLEQCLDYLQPTPYLVESTDYKNEFETPVLTAGKTFILGYTNEKDNVFSEKLPVIIFDDFTTDSKFVDFPFKAKSSAMKILLAKDGANIRFIYESMQNIKFEVGVHKRHWISVFSKLKIPFPTLPEQQKIASCLYSLDELITAESQKLETLKEHKKGLMQNLFPQEGETVPKFRFKEFEGEWVEKKLGEVCLNIVSGKDKNEINGEYYLYGSTGIIGKTNSVSYDGDFILVARVGANAGFLNRINSKFGVTDNTLVISLTNSQSVDFIYYALENFGLNKLIFGSGQPLITGRQLKNLKLPFPSKPEQQKIASCLSSLDDLITKQTEKIEQLKQHKKGLLQGLFPTINEI